MGGKQHRLIFCNRKGESQNNDRGGGKFGPLSPSPTGSIKFGENRGRKWYGGAGDERAGGGSSKKNGAGDKRMGVYKFA